MDVTIRNANQKDLGQILKVEESWPEEGRATAEKFIARLKKFRQGFFVVEQRGRLVATVTACPMTYDPNNPREFKNWNQVTNDGFLDEIGEIEKYNALYIVSGVIDKNYRGKDLFDLAINREAELAKELKLRYVVAGAVIPGYKKYCDKHGEIPASEYALKRQDNHCIDPLLEMYRKIGFNVPDADHVVSDYYPDSASKDYAALTVRDLG